MGIGIYEAFLAIDWLGSTEEVQAMGRFSGMEIDMFSIFPNPAPAWLRTAVRRVRSAW
jgi:hypothetical protein